MRTFDLATLVSTAALATTLVACGSDYGGKKSANDSKCATPFHCDDNVTADGSGHGSGDARAASDGSHHVAVQKWSNPPADIQHNLDQLNALRVAAGVPALVLDKALSGFADEGSQQLASSNVAHGHFIKASESDLENAGFCLGGAENQAPGWPVQGETGPTIDAMLKAMMDEGPGGGHHDTILSRDYGRVGIGLLSHDGSLWLTNDFSPACD